MSSQEPVRFSKTHEWIQPDGDYGIVGITDHAQEELGDVALVLFPEVGMIVRAGEKFGEIESIKAVSDLYAPVSGEIAAVNEKLLQAPEMVNDDPEGDGWMIRIKMSAPDELDSLMDKAAYDAFLEE